MDTASISRNVVVDVPIVADANVALDKLNEWAEPIKTAEWQKQIKAWYEKRQGHDTSDDYGAYQ